MQINVSSASSAKALLCPLHKLTGKSARLNEDGVLTQFIVYIGLECPCIYSAPYTSFKQCQCFSSMPFQFPSF